MFQNILDEDKGALKKLAIITTHPIQYNAPWFRLLAEREKLHIFVFYTWGQLEAEKKFDPGFGKNVEWDIPLLNGYPYKFVKNISTKPGSDHFNGIDNPSLIHEIESWNPDSVLVFGWCFKSHLRVLRYFKGKRLVLFRGDSTLLDEQKGFSFKTIIRRFSLKWVYSHIDIALYVGTANREYYLKHGLKSNQLFFTPHAVDNVRFAGDVKSIERKTLGIPDHSIVFLFTGKMERKKNPLMLLEAFVQLGNYDAHLLLVGDGSEEATLKREVTKSGPLMKNIHFLPFQNQLQMPSIYKLCDVFVLPSQGPGETWGLSVNEAMACRKPVLVSNKCGCASDLVRDKVNGFIFYSLDKEDLLKKMNFFLKSRSEIAGMGMQSFNIISQWNYEKICASVESTII